MRPGTPGTRTVTIANGATVSAAADMGAASLVGIITPAALTGTAFGLQASADGVSYADVYGTSGSAVSVTAAPSRYIAVPRTTIDGARFVRVVSGSAEGGARSITLVVD